MKRSFLKINFFTASEWCRANGVRMETRSRTRHPLQHDGWTSIVPCPANSDGLRRVTDCEWHQPEVHCRPMLASHPAINDQLVTETHVSCCPTISHLPGIRSQQSTAKFYCRPNIAHGKHNGHVDSPRQPGQGFLCPPSGLVVSRAHEELVQR